MHINVIEKEITTRRKVLKTTGCGIAAFAGTGIGSANTTEDDAARELQDRYKIWEGAYDRLVKEYGEEEVKILAKIAIGEADKVEQNKITEREAIENVHGRVLEHPNIQKISADVREHVEWKESRNARIQESTDNVQPVRDSSQFENLQPLSSNSLLLGNTEEDSSSSIGPNTGAYTSARPTTVSQTGRMRGVATAGGGSASYLDKNGREVSDGPLGG